MVEFSHMVMGPACGMVLADLGAEVIKVEPVDGDLHAPPAGRGRGILSHVQPQQEKRCHRPAQALKALQAAIRLAATADVVVQNFKPGRDDEVRAGLCPALSQLNPASST